MWTACAVVDRERTLVVKTSRNGDDEVRVSRGDVQRFAFAAKRINTPPDFKLLTDRTEI